MYERVDQHQPLDQGDVLDGVELYSLPDELPNEGELLKPDIWSAQVIVLTQSCDLAQGKTKRVVVAPVHAAQQLVDSGLLKESAVRDQVRRHLVFGWYFLPASAAPVSFLESLVDLRDLHTVPLALLHRLIADGRRVCRVVTPYREHLAQHFAVTYMRIGLPEPYPTQP